MKEPCFSCNGIFVHNCKSPNLQGLPRDATKIEVLDENPIRRLFVARYLDSYLVEFDYSQQEVRVIATLADDNNMITAFNEGKDIHKYVASIVFNKDYDKIEKFERQVAKGCVFGAIYGVSASALAMNLGIDERAADAHLKSFFRTFPKIKLFTESKGREAEVNGIVRTITGRSRKFIVTRKNANACKREAANHCFHGSTKVLLADGSYMSIKNIVEKKLSVDVMSYNKVTKSYEPNRIVNWFKTPYPKAKWLSVMGCGHSRGPMCTPEHKFYTQRGIVKAGDLKYGDMLCTNMPAVSGTVCEQVILGSILGDGRISSNPSYRLYIGHGPKQYEYLMYKYNILRGILGGKVSRRLTSASSFKPGNLSYLYVSSMRCVLLDYKNMKYPNLLVEKVIDNITWFGLAIWYQDDGCFCRRRTENKKNWRYQIRLHTESFNFDEVRRLSLALFKKFGVRFNVHKRKVSGKSYFILETSKKEYIDKFCSGVAPYVHASMEYKLPSIYRKKFVSVVDKVKRLAFIKCLGTRQIKHSVDKRRNTIPIQYRVKYNIEVEHNHNYFVKAGNWCYLVKNCIQALSADMTYLSLIQVNKVLAENGLLNKDVFIVLTVHDSIFLDVRKSALPFVLREVPRIMADVPKNILKLKVPFIADASIGQRWGECLDVKKVLEGVEV